MEVRIHVVKTPEQALSYKNTATITSGLHARLGNAKYVLINGKYPLKVETYSGTITDSQIGLNGKQRTWIGVGINSTVSVTKFEDTQVKQLSSMTVVVDAFNNKKLESKLDINESDLFKIFHTFSIEETLFSSEQKVVIEPMNVRNQVLEGEIVLETKEFKAGEIECGIITQNIRLTFVEKEGSSISLVRQQSKLDWDFGKMGIGGQDKELQEILRRAFYSRALPQEVIDKIGMKHVRGILLYGPPGTGKTLIARKIGMKLSKDSKEPRIVNGPEILSKYQGEAEANVRKIFEDAYAKSDEDLHVIIFDEIDAICRQRGSQGESSASRDTIVNQLLAEIDGVKELNNIILIGMTNRKDIIDEALLRPGRFEVQIEIGLPNEDGRKQILDIHTKRLKEEGMLDETVNTEKLAKETENYSGAELEGLVRCATSYAIGRMISVHEDVDCDTSNPFSSIADLKKVEILEEDFDRAQKEVIPAFGSSDKELECYIGRGFVECKSSLTEVCSTIKRRMKPEKSSLYSMLLTGDPGVGKTAFAAHLAKKNEFPFVKVISPREMIGLSDMAKCQRIKKVFDNAYKTPIGCIIIDDIERLLDYINIGSTSQFSNSVLQALLVLLRSPPPPKCCLVVLGTTSLSIDELNNLKLTDAFKERYEVPYLCGGDEIMKILEQGNGEVFDNDVRKELMDSKLEITLTASDLMMLMDEFEMSPDVGKFKERLKNLQSKTKVPK